MAAALLTAFCHLPPAAAEPGYPIEIAFVRSDRRFPEIWLADGPDGFAAARPLTAFNAALDRHPAPKQVPAERAGFATIGGEPEASPT